MQSTLVSGCPDVSATTASGAAFDTSELELQTFAYSIHTHAALFAVGTTAVEANYRRRRPGLS